MKLDYSPSLKLLTVIPLLLLLTSCAAGNDQFKTEIHAGFWIGLWHGMASFQ